MRCRYTSLTRAVCWALVLRAATCLAQNDSYAEGLISRLGCTNCHASQAIASTLTENIPNLSYAGLRYNPAYLLDFLQNPQNVRKHIGPARMPDFRLDEAEALALVLFLEAQDQRVSSWPTYPSGLDRLAKEASNEALVVEDETCLSCHSMNGKGGVFAVDLSSVGHRLQEDWVRKYLAAPFLFDVPETTMLAVFFELSPDRRRFIEILPDAADKIHRLTRRLFFWGRHERGILERRLRDAKASHHHVTAETGKRIFRSQNCTACHFHHDVQPFEDGFAPDLTIEGFRVREEWLADFIKRPSTIRPSGCWPGWGNRMPDFRLSDNKTQTLTAYLMDQRAVPNESLDIYFPQDLTAFSMEKAKTLLEEKLSCLGCHRLGDVGGRIGPNLSSIRDRLNPLYMFNQIGRTRTVSPDAIMPQISLRPRTLELVFNFLFQQTIGRDSTSQVSLVENRPLFPEYASVREDDYRRYCALCHGRDGDGDGFNAEAIFPVKPTVHSDSATMSVRPDDTLFDGIYAGGYILNKHPFMPPWGLVLSRERIRGLVAYIRELCGCQGPEWSLDDLPTE